MEWENQDLGKKGNIEVLEKGVTIRLKTILIVVLLIGAFLLGRYVFPVGTTEEAAPEALAEENISVNETVEEDTESTEEQQLLEEETEEPVPENQTVSTNITQETEEETDENETIITDNYANVQFKFSRTPIFDWKGTWGKITTIYYEITNNEDGTILPDNIVITVEGYEDPELYPPKIIPIPSIDDEIKSGETTKHGVDIAITYNEAVTDPTNILLTMELRDASNNTIDTTSQEFNLKE